ncbi:O-antigen ligase family protein [Flavobacterium alkalisoli]|uniref:O-antigen ligase family protein n=1 Tax=Flavobacterium alkalisoli TaxID=2602769 RepID=A0A5B9FTD1_9FLAO|nr:O-antigen ligase family protein [Flavobacterium alkalisoli]QEE49459.1 O-antigen ligase family protein [Flavobacterium alkalisoli]
MLQATNKKKGSWILFVILFFVNIGFKEVIRFLEVNDFLLEGIFVLTFISLMIFFISNTYQLKNILWLVVLFYFFLLFMSFQNLDILKVEYGLQKVFLGLFVPVLCIIVFNRYEWDDKSVLKYLIISVSIISIIGILYKLKGGFFDRSVSFGLLGSIPFGWVNGMAFLSLVLVREKSFKQIVLSLFFLTMIIWTGSKGPLLGVVLVCLIFWNRVLGKKVSTKIIVFSIVCIAFFILLIYSDDIRSVRMIIDFLADPEEYSEGVGKGSVGTRQEYIATSWKLFLENPIFGVGFGGWQSNFTDHKYPHNVSMEMLAETGFVGFVFFLYLLFKLKYKKIIAYVGLYGMMTLLFSGDFSYFRYAFFPLLLAYVSNDNTKL